MKLSTLCLTCQIKSYQMKLKYARYLDFCTEKERDILLLCIYKNKSLLSLKSRKKQKTCNDSIPFQLRAEGMNFDSFAMINTSQCDTKITRLINSKHGDELIVGYGVESKGTMLNYLWMNLMTPEETDVICVILIRN